MWAIIECNSLSSNVDKAKLKLLIEAIAKSLRENDKANPNWSFEDNGFTLNSGPTLDDCPYWPAEEAAYAGFDPDEIATILEIVNQNNDNGEYFFVTLGLILKKFGWLPEGEPCGTVRWEYESEHPNDKEPWPSA